MRIEVKIIDQNGRVAILIVHSGTLMFDSGIEELVRTATRTLDTVTTQGLILDLRGVSRFDHAGCAACIEVHALASRRGVWFALCVPHAIRHLFAATCPRMFALYETREDALAAFAGRP